MTRFGRIGLGLLFLVMGGTAAQAGEPARTVDGIKNPESAVAGPDGAVYVTEIGEFDTDGDGRVLRIAGEGEPEPFATGLDDPKGIDVQGESLIVADKVRVLRIGPEGEVNVLAAADDFPRSPQFLNDIEVAGDGTVYVSDSGELDGGGGAIFRIDSKGEVGAVLTMDQDPRLRSPNGLLMDGPKAMLVVDLSSGALYRLPLDGAELKKLNRGFGGGDGLAWDDHGRLYVSDWQNGRVYWLKEPAGESQLMVDDLKAAADIAIGPEDRLLVPDMKAGALVYYPLPE